MVKHQTTYRVIYGDTDNMGVAYYANYLRWFEIGRAELFRSLGLSYKSVEAEGIFLPVSEAFCKYKNPARYDDVITIETSVDATVKGGLKLDYTILDEAGERVLATGYTKHACVDRNGRITRPPKFLRDKIQNSAASE